MSEIGVGNGRLLDWSAASFLRRAADRLVLRFAGASLGLVFYHNC
jgi:hypothetical protein